LRRKVNRNFWQYRNASAQCPTVIAPYFQNYRWDKKYEKCSREPPFFVSAGKKANPLQT
jgi:hypothetical protein